VKLTSLDGKKLAFHLLHRQKRLSERMRDIRLNKFRISSSNNKHEDAEIFQYGGTAVMAFDEAAHRVHKTVVTQLD